jgi:hypothetical protein
LRRKDIVRKSFVVLALLVLLSPVPATVAGSVGGPEASALPEELSRSARRWVRHTLADMSLEEKAAQLVAVRTFGYFENPRSEVHQNLLRQVRDLGVGGVLGVEGSVYQSAGDDEPGLDDEGPGDADALALPAAELVRVAAGGLRRQPGRTPGRTG